jgi:hypothetical protein
MWQQATVRNSFSLCNSSGTPKLADLRGMESNQRERFPSLLGTSSADRGAAFSPGHRKQAY